MVPGGFFSINWIFLIDDMFWDNRLFVNVESIKSNITAINYDLLLGKLLCFYWIFLYLLTHQSSSMRLVRFHLNRKLWSKNCSIIPLLFINIRTSLSPSLPWISFSFGQLCFSLWYTWQFPTCDYHINSVEDPFSLETWEHLLIVRRLAR